MNITLNLFLIVILCVCMCAGVGLSRCLTWCNTRDISVSQLPTRLVYSSFTVEKHQHSDPGKATSEAGSDTSF